MQSFWEKLQIRFQDILRDKLEGGDYREWCRMISAEAQREKDHMPGNDPLLAEMKAIHETMQKVCHMEDIPLGKPSPIPVTFMVTNDQWAEFRKTFKPAPSKPDHAEKVDQISRIIYYGINSDGIRTIPMAWEQQTCSVREYYRRIADQISPIVNPAS